ncbi:MAG: DUF4268 domain-containing protein [Candidatus Omnitrophota bacterium]|jgi:hypothetical protein|nr:MAG: DUF4268 domain-containing protein [Candidatus Omnitrophota bacterium]
MIGRLDKVDLRKAWMKETKDFSTWLENNLDILSEQIGFDLSPIEREKSVGTFSADIFAEGPNGDTVVIENQLEKTDHDHLGKLITYLSNLEAKTAIWITSEPRPEHVTAINWLNEISPADTAFFLVKVEAYKIGESEPAPLFTAICAPSEEAKQIGEQKQQLAERHLRRLDFWKQLLEKAKSKTNLHSNVSPSKDNWITAGAGKSGMGWIYVITLSRGSVELFIDRGPDKKDETDKIYEKIYNDREKIENLFGEPLVWDKVEGRRVCRIRSICTLGGLKDAARWDKIQEDLTDRMMRLEKALKPTLSTVK